MATTESVKAKIQNLITKANDTTNLADKDLTNAVNHLVEGYGQGGSGGGSSECSGEHVIEVEELPTENIDENALYKMGESYYKAGEKALKDVLALEGGTVASLVEAFTNAYNAKFELYYADNVEDIPEADRKMPDESSLVFPLYYDAHTSDVKIWAGIWASLSETLLDGMTSGGAITDLNEVATEGVYYALIGDAWKKYSVLDGKTVIEVSELPTTGIDENAVYTIKSEGVCYADLGLPPLPVVVGLDYYLVGVYIGDSTGETLCVSVTDLPYSQENIGITIHGNVYTCKSGDDAWELSWENWSDAPSDLELDLMRMVARFANYDILTFKGGAFSRSYYEYKNETWIDVTKAFEGVRTVDSALPIEISDESKMNSLLNTAEVGSVYKYMGTTGTYENDTLYMVATATNGSKCFKKLTAGSDDVGYLTFSSPNSFTLSVKDSTKHWNGTLEYSTDTTTWNIWDGTTTLSADDGVLHMRGTGNTVITGYSPTGAYSWVLSGSNIACEGSIENLLDYIAVVNGLHPIMAYGCYHSMFANCKGLTVAPELPAITLANSCYEEMFHSCENLVTAPELPAITLTESCYKKMFIQCTSLTKAPELPATTLAGSCYREMFYWCTSLTKAPELPATTLVGGCYQNMFYGCKGLTVAPELPATTLARECYRAMFMDCSSLTTIPELHVTTLAESCYHSMFYGCTSLITVPELPATTLATNCYRGMFQRCTGIKLSSVQTSEYQTEYRVPTSGTGTTATDALLDMFSNTGGTFKGTPEINTTYYTSNTVV